MQLTQKHIISIIVSGLVLMGGYFAFQNFTASQLNEVNTSTGASNSITGSIVQTGSDINTKWGPSQFASGSSHSGSTDSGATVFQMPKTEWRSRSVTLNDGRTLYYEFGKGNPVGVAMSLEQIDAMTKTCENNISLAEKGICNVESGNMSYITPEVEKHLFLALSDSNWSKLATECENSFRAREGSDALENARNDRLYLIFDRVFEPGFLDIDRFISVDPATGLKMLNGNLTISLAKFIMNGMHDGALRGEAQPNPYGDCIDRYGKNIAIHLVATTNLYMRPLQSAE
jgi:hypothetical protein